MNLRTFVVGVFTHGLSSIFGKQLDSVRAQARRDAQIVGGAYLDEFDQTMLRMFRDRQRRLIGSDQKRLTSR